MGMSIVKTVIYKDKLQALYQFTDNDLELNRQGQLTVEQAQKLKSSAQTEIVVFFIPSLIMALGIVYHLIRQLPVPSVAIFLLVCSLFFGFLAPSSTEPRLLSVKGQIRLEKGWGRVPYYLCLGDEKFIIYNNAYQLFSSLAQQEPDTEWVAYYTEKSKLILSMERLLNEA
jgi:hypothetical protein